MYWFTSDQHFYHNKIVQYDERPVAVEDHNAFLVERWNSAVKEDDTVYHLGDFCFGGKQQARMAFEQLNGSIIILGNHFHHDRGWISTDGMTHPKYGRIDMETKTSQVYLAPPLVVLEKLELRDEFDVDTKLPPIVLCHYPFKVWDRAHYGSWHLYGHTHQKTNKVKKNRFSMNVGVTANGYRPISLHEVREHMLECGWTEDWKNYEDHRVRN